MILKITSIVDKNTTNFFRYYSFDKENHICLYVCDEKTDAPPASVQSYNDYKYKIYYK